MLRRTLGNPPPPPVESGVIVQPVGVPIRVGRDTSHVPTGLEYPRDGRLTRDQIRNVSRVGMT